MKTIKYILFIISCLIAGCNAAFAQTPVSPVQLTTNTAYLEPSTGFHWYYNGATYAWWTALGLRDSTHYITPYYFSQHSTPSGTALLKANNLSDVANAVTSLANINGVPLSRTITINGTTHDLTANSTYTVTSTASNALTIGNGLLGTSYNGAVPVTISADTSIIESVNRANTVIGTAALNRFSLYAPINSPAFTGIPTAPTASIGTNTNQLATMAAIQQAITAIGAGTVSSMHDSTTNGVGITWVNRTTTPAPVVTLGAITPTSTNGVSAATMSYNDATSSIQTQLNGKQASLGFTAENVANKSTTTTLGTSNTLYPTQNAVKTYVDNSITGITYTAGYGLNLTGLQFKLDTTTAVNKTFFNSVIGTSSLARFVQQSTTVAGKPLTGNVTLSTLANGYGVLPFSYNGSVGASTIVDTLSSITSKSFFNNVIGTASLTRFVPQSRTITINGITYDLSSNSVYNITAAPTGTAGGDLSGTYPNPTVNTINSITKSYYDPTSSIQTQLNSRELLSNKTATASTSTTTYPNWLGVENYAAPIGGSTIYKRIDDSASNSGYVTHGYFNNYAVKKITTIIYADDYTDSLATAIFNNGAGINTGSAIVKAINAAHALGGAIIILSQKTYFPTGYSFTNPMLYDNIYIKGAGQSYYAADCKSLVGGTIILGGIEVFANNFSLTDVSLDGGKTVCDTYYASVAQQPFVFLGSTPTSKATTTKTNVFLQNITCLSYSPTALAHSFDVENASGGYVNNILTCYGIYGSIIKSDNIIVGSMRAYENSTYPFIIKSDSVDNIAIAKNVTINSLTYDLAPPNTTPYISASTPIAALNIDANGNDVTNIHIGEINILTNVDYGDYFSAFIGNINGVKIDHTNILADSTNVGVYIAENNVTGLYFGEINAHNTSDPYYDNSTSIGTNYIGNLIADNHGVSPGAQGIFLNGSGKRLNIGAYYSNNNTDTYNLASGDTVAVANENIINNTTYNAGAGIIIAKANTNGSNASGTWPISITGNSLTVTTNANSAGDVTSVGNATTYNNIVPSSKGGAGSINGLVKANGSGLTSLAVANTDYLNTSYTGFDSRYLGLHATADNSTAWNNNTIFNGFYTSGTINAILLNNSTNSRIEFGSASTIQTFLGLGSNAYTTNPMTTLGDIIYGGSSGTPTRLAGNTGTGTAFLTSTGTGSASTAPTYFNLFGTSNTWNALQTYTYDANFNGGITVSQGIAIVNSGLTKNGVLQAPTLTASRSWVLPDSSGHVALREYTFQTPTGNTSQYIDGTGALQTYGQVRAKTIFTPTTGQTIALTNNAYNIVNPSGALLALTINLPSSPGDRNTVFIKFTQTISTVTYGNGTVVDGITAPTAGGLTMLVYDASSNSWY